MYMFVDTRDVVVIGHGFKYLRISKKTTDEIVDIRQRYFNNVSDQALVSVHRQISSRPALILHPINVHQSKTVREESRSISIRCHRVRRHLGSERPRTELI